ncbi:hypothetical protein ACOSP7_012797 [Xanthoceras sorbifolium]
MKIFSPPSFYVDCTVNSLRTASGDWNEQLIRDSFQEDADAIMNIPPGRQSRWIRPRPGVVKINTDAGISLNNSKVGLGVIIRGSDGQVLASCGKPLKALHSPLIAKSLAVLCGISLSVDARLVPASLETDSETLVKLVNSNAAPLSEVGLFVSEIVQALNSGVLVNFSFVPRLANATAHCIAKTTLSLDSFPVWM